MKSISWKPTFRFPGTEHSWQDLNNLIQAETLNDEPWFMGAEDFRQAVRDGFVTYENGETVIWVEAEG